jgi:hypothetical protein
MDWKVLEGAHWDSTVPHTMSTLKKWTPINNFLGILDFMWLFGCPWTLLKILKKLVNIS